MYHSKMFIFYFSIFDGEKSSLLSKLLRYFAQIKRQTLILLLRRAHHGKNYDVANKFFSLIYTCSLWGCHTFYLCKLMKKLHLSVVALCFAEWCMRNRVAWNQPKQKSRKFITPRVKPCRALISRIAVCNNINLQTRFFCNFISIILININSKLYQNNVSFIQKGYQLFLIFLNEPLWPKCNS